MVASPVYNGIRILALGVLSQDSRLKRKETWSSDMTKVGHLRLFGFGLCQRRERGSVLIWISCGLIVAFDIFLGSCWISSFLSQASSAPVSQGSQGMLLTGQNERRKIRWKWGVEKIEVGRRLGKTFRFCDLIHTSTSGSSHQWDFLWVRRSHDLGEYFIRYDIYICCRTTRLITAGEHVYPGSHTYIGVHHTSQFSSPRSNSLSFRAIASYLHPPPHTPVSRQTFSLQLYLA